MLTCWTDIAQIIYQAVIVVGAPLGLWLAYRRCRTADHNLEQEKFRIGSELLDIERRDYAARVAGAAILAELSKENPEKYTRLAMKAFEAFLEFPPRFGHGHFLANRTDYGSRDALEIVRAINRRSRREKAAYPSISLSERSPFRIQDDKVTGDPDHEDGRHWLASWRRFPDYN